MDGRYLTASPEDYPKAVFFREAALSQSDAAPSPDESAAGPVEATQHASTITPASENPVQAQASEGNQRLYVMPPKPELLPGRETSAAVLGRAKQYFVKYNQAKARGEKLPRKLGVLWFDFDDFKEMQDAHPRKHAAGDDIINLGLETARRTIRSEDVPPDEQKREKTPIEHPDEVLRIRYIMRDAVLARRYESAGDEFIVLVEVDSQEDLEKIGQRIQAALANIRDEDLAPNGIRVSYGAKIHENETSAPALFGAADFRLFLNKMTRAYEAGYAERPLQEKILFDLAALIFKRLGITGRQYDKITAARKLVATGVLPQPERSTDPQHEDTLEQAAFFAAIGRELLQQFPLLFTELSRDIDDDGHDVRPA